MEGNKRELYRFFLENHPDEIVKLEENLFLYMEDSFDWVPTVGSYDNDRMGLDYIGIANITQQSSLLMFKNIFSAWKELFNVAPETFTLTGVFEYSSDSYSKNSYSKKEVIQTLDKLIKMTTKGIETNQTIIVEGL